MCRLCVPFLWFRAFSVVSLVWFVAVGNNTIFFFYFFFVRCVAFCVFLMTHNRPLPVFSRIHEQIVLCRHIVCTLYSVHAITDEAHKSIVSFSILFPSPTVQRCKVSEHDALRKSAISNWDSYMHSCGAPSAMVEQRRLALCHSIKMAIPIHMRAQQNAPIRGRSVHTHTARRTTSIGCLLLGICCIFFHRRR